MRFHNPKFYHSSQITDKIVTIMSETQSPARLGQSLLDFLKVRHGDQLKCHNYGWFRTQEPHTCHGFQDLATVVNNALDDLLGTNGTGDGTDVVGLPECMRQRKLCDWHHQICVDFLSRSSSEAPQDLRNQHVPPTKEPGLMLFGMEASSDHSSHEELCSSSVCTDEAEQEMDDDGEDGLHEVPGNGFTDDLDDISDYNEVDEDGLPSNVDACDVAEYDKEEVIRKDQVSQRYRKRVEVDEDDKRTLVSVSDDDDRSGSITDPTPRDTATDASRTNPRVLREHSSSSPSTPMNTASSLQRSYDACSARKNTFNNHHENSPSRRTLRAVTTLAADPRYDEEVESNAQAVRQQIIKPFNSRSGNSAYGDEGFVYIFRDNELPLIKIGHTTGSLEARKAHIEKTCGFVKNMSLVAAVKVKAYKRLEKIIHQDLAPYRWFFDCACGRSKTQQGFTRHQEYFEIDVDTAFNTLQLWADFVERQPWRSILSCRRDTDLRLEWNDKILAPLGVESSETHGSHNDRVKRWRRFLGIPDPEVEVTKWTSKSLHNIQSATQRHNTVAGPIKSSTPDCTPSKPPRPANENVAEADKLARANNTLSGSPKPPSSSSEPTKLTHEQSSYSTAHGSTFTLTDRTKDSKTTSNGLAASTALSPQAESASDGQSVPAAKQQPSTVFSGTHQSPQSTNKSSEEMNDKASSARKILPCRPVSAVPSIVHKPTTEPGQFSNISFNQIWPSSSGENSKPPAKPSSTVGREQSNNREAAAGGNDLKNAHQPHNEAQSSGTGFAPSQKTQTHATTMSASPLVHSTFELATCLLAKEVRPLPARAISADIWQFRWPLACSIVFALHSPHIPAGLSFLMWSIFLPFFVAELRGWTVVSQT